MSATLQVGNRSLTSGLGKATLAMLGLLLLAIILPHLLPLYYVSVLTRVIIFAVFAVGLNLLMGYTGLPSLGQGAYFGTGAFAVGILTVTYNVPHPIAIFGAIAIAGLLAALYGLVALRARGSYFLLITMALTQATWAIAFTWRSVTGGEDGFPGVTRPGFLPWSLTDGINYYYFTLFFLVISIVAFVIIVRSPFGLALQGIRENEQRMRSLGYNTWLYMYIAFIIAGVFAGLAGVLNAYSVGAVSAQWAEVLPSAEVLLMVILGGPGTIIGPLVGAGVIIPLSEIANIYTERWVMVLGGTYIILMLFARDGIVGRLRRLAAHWRPA